mmetsp:Transcript_28901/g.42842  ORF Transcript_28901/g.42842 Transcript_28901/m.42842 type:complete len:304 (+) Transcript_28901:36-947(+)|eukprot:CAMPEP_0195507888 /NCGR_PEP_ID=MMETSP0794_2-20130614/1242_1 /TAXON_ID=515487 /ORGANISM="Stephanopyxis turris, Strain CCMP 815" /LENGTH=303 /DNA_ID=CAMNT_0040634713 /DNA_START=34 /DNA_END=945 /DNA_ORIENTATION=+
MVQVRTFSSVFLFFLSETKSIAAFSGTFAPVSELLSKHSSNIAFLKDEAAAVSDASSIPCDDIFYLRYCVEYDDDIKEAALALAENIKWRNNEGKSLCDAASSAVEKAMSNPEKWDNTAVRDSAPHASIVNEYITSSSILTTTSTQGDLVYCIRAGQIDDLALMTKISVEDMADFFLYCKEVNSIVANKRSLSSDRLVTIITANDLSGVSLFGDATFRKALSAGSKKASTLYPSLNGPTLLLNLPKLLGGLVKLFTPLFSAEVRKKLRFEQGPLKDIGDLTDIMGGDGRDKFMKEIDTLVYSD